MITAAILAAALVGGTGGMGLQISPAQVVGQSTSQASFTYKDAGTTTENIRVQAVELKPVTVKGQHGWSPYGEADYATVTPERFTLHPGQRQVIKVTMHATDGKTHNVAIMATADGNSTVAGGRISASVGARYVVSAPTSHGVPLAPLAGLAGLCVALLAGLGYVLRKRSRRNRQTEATNPYGMIP